MARKKISEYKTKKLLHDYLHTHYEGMRFESNKDELSLIDTLDAKKKYVLKVDEGVKKRFRKGLVLLNKTPLEIKEELKRIQETGYKNFIIEPFLSHAEESEKYLSIERVREGYLVFYFEKGGIDIENYRKDIKKSILSSYSDGEEITKYLGIDKNLFESILKFFDEYYFSFLEINPLVIQNNRIIFLDIASEVDSAGEFFVHNGWDSEDFQEGKEIQKTDEEKNIDELSRKSQASFKLEVLNPNGSIFMLLSGGGASIVLADETYNLGYGKAVANYGEYSGNPNEEEAYLYTKNLLSLLLKSNVQKKVLIIGGGVANFTNILITFKGVIAALKEVAEKLKEQQVKVFVRRGGPNQEEGLKVMEQFLNENGILGAVRDPKTSLPEIITLAIKELQ